MRTEKIPVQIEGQLKAPVYHHREAPKGLPKLHFLSAFYGVRAAGKTTALMKLLRSYIQAGSFDVILFYSPTARIDPKNKALLFPICNVMEPEDELPKKIDKPLLYVFEDPTKDDVDFGLDFIKKQQEDWKSYLKQKQVWDRLVRKGVDSLTDDEVLLLEFGEPHSPFKAQPSTIIVFDDCVGNRSVFGNNRLTNFITKHRHFNTSMVWCLQAFKGQGTTLGLQMRNNLSFCLLWSCKNQQMRRDFAATLAGRMTPEQVERCWDFATAEPYGFLYLDFADMETGVRKGFEEVIQM